MSLTANFNIVKAGKKVIVPAPESGSIEVLDGEFGVKSSVSVLFSHTDQAIDATRADRPRVPPGILAVGKALTVSTTTNAQVKGWVSYRVSTTQPTPEPEPTPEPTPTPEPVPEPTPTPEPPQTPDEEPAPTPAPPVPGAKPVIAPRQFSYLGVLRMPASGVDFANSYGQLTGRKVNGQVRLLMFGNRAAGDPVYEMTEPGTYSKTVATAPRLSLVKDWGSVYGTARKTWLADGTPRDITNTVYPGSLHWNETTQLLYWTFVDSYNTTAEQDWCLGATDLNAAGVKAYGPWRPAGEGKAGPWRCIRVAQHPQSGELLCGSGVMSGNHSSPWGPDLWAGQFPTAATTAGFGAPDVPLQKYVTYYPMFQNINHDGTFSGPLKACRRGDYLFEPILGDSTYAQIDPAKNGGVGSWSELDSLGGSAWLDLPDCHGVIFTGKLAAKHIWYRNAGQGNDTCTHGLPSPINVTGPVSTDAYPIIYIYDPAVLAAVRAGTVVDYTVEPSALINCESAFGLETAAMTENTAKTLGGCYFDPESRKLYVAAASADVDGIQRLPVVHVFQVGT